MSDDARELKEATEHWKNSENNQRALREKLVGLLVSKLDKYNLTELSGMTGIKRTTLYYMIWGKGGKRQKVT